MANVYDTANQLEREIRDLDQFKALSASFGKLKESKPAYDLFKEFQSFQQDIQQRMAAGEEMTDDDAAKAQKLAERIQKEPLIKDLMDKEQSFSLVINDLNRIIMDPLRELYEG